MKSVTTEHRKGNAEIFKAPFLESLTKTNLKTSIIVYGLTVFIFIYTAIFIFDTPLSTFAILFFSSILTWTLTEYLLHRYLFHWLSENPLIQRFHFIMHGSHHLYPKDNERLLMPPVPGLIMGAILFGIQYLFFLVVGYEGYTWGFFSGFFLGYLLYSFLHRAMHVYKAPKGFEGLWMHHLIHHYKYPNKAFGVSNSFWDHIFRTMPPKD